MHLEKNVNVTDYQKKKLMEFTSQDLQDAKVSQRNITIYDVYPEEDENAKKIKELDMEEESSRLVNRTPLLINQLTRSLFKINLNEDITSLDQIHLPNKQQVQYNVSSIEKLKQEELY